MPPWHVDGIGALMTTRQGGTSSGAWESMNLGLASGDDPQAVARNRELLQSTSGVRHVYLRQVHGVRVVHLDSNGAARSADGALIAVSSPGDPVEADACITTEAGIACTVMAADCLPVLFAAPRARAVGAAHAGWRGLAAGVLEATVEAVCEAAGCEPGELEAWLGACIGPRRFEVGADVLAAFYADTQANPGEAEPRTNAPRFVPHAPGKWLANLPLLARDRLAAAGVWNISGGELCTVEEESLFFSYRRDGITGRMAAAVWIER